MVRSASRLGRETSGCTVYMVPCDAGLHRMRRPLSRLFSKENDPMEDRKIVWVRRAAYLSIAVAGFLLLPSCAVPATVAWNRKQSVIEPQVPPPQGELDVYSESYVFY